MNQSLVLKPAELFPVVQEQDSVGGSLSQGLLHRLLVTDAKLLHVDAVAVGLVFHFTLPPLFFLILPRRIPLCKV
jgi:hypothetical protein